MEAVGLLGNLRSPIHAMIAFSESMLSDEFGTLGEGYKSHAKVIRVDAQQILQAVNQAVCAGSSNANGIKFESGSLIFDLLNHIIGSSKIIRYGLLGPVQEQYRERAKRIHGNADALLDDMYSVQVLLNEDLIPVWNRQATKIST